MQPPRQMPRPCPQRCKGLWLETAAKQTFANAARSDRPHRQGRRSLAMGRPSDTATEGELPLTLHFPRSWPRMQRAHLGQQIQHEYERLYCLILNRLLLRQYECAQRRLSNHSCTCA